MCFLVPDGGAAAITCDLSLSANSGDGTLTYAMSFTNTTSENQNADLWMNVTGPAGFDEQLFLKNKNFAPAASATKNKAYTISGTAGEYTFSLYTGTYPDVIQDSDSEMYTVTLSSVSAHQGESLIGEVPLRTELVQNYPNPFNPSTRIRYSLASPANVSLVVYDMTGQQVRQLATGNWQLAGDHEVVWDGRNNAGKPCGERYLFLSIKDIPLGSPSKGGNREGVAGSKDDVDAVRAFQPLLNSFLARFRFWTA